MEPNGPVRVHLVSFVHSLSYRHTKVNLDPITINSSGDHLEPPQGPLVVPGPLVENHCSTSNLFEKQIANLQRNVSF